MSGRIPHGELVQIDDDIYFDEEVIDEWDEDVESYNDLCITDDDE